MTLFVILTTKKSWNLGTKHKSDSKTPWTTGKFTQLSQIATTSTLLTLVKSQKLWSRKLEISRENINKNKSRHLFTGLYSFSGLFGQTTVKFLVIASHTFLADSRLESHFFILFWISSRFMVRNKWVRSWINWFFTA